MAFDDKKLPYAPSAFKEELFAHLSSKDARLFGLFALRTDNKNLLEHLRQPASWEFQPGGSLTAEAADHYMELVTQEREGERVSKQAFSGLPPYLHAFLRLWQESAGEASPIAWEDRLAALYYAYAMGCKNRFAAEWFALNLNVNNTLAALTCRKFGLDRNLYIVGQTAVCEHLRTSNARDFDLGDQAEALHLDELLRLADETDLMRREKAIDQLKWNWLDEATESKVFDFESLLAYYFKLEMLERWATLDRETGEQAFRTLVGKMKKGSDKTLDEFKRNNTK